MSKYDNQQYQNLFVETNAGLEGGTEMYKVDLLLAGHIHAYDVVDAVGQERILVADKMLYDSKNKNNGYIVHDMKTELKNDVRTHEIKQNRI